MSRTVKGLLIGAIYTSALFLFTLQVRDVFIKYFERKTTISTSQRTLDQIQVPFVTICSGFKPSQLPEDAEILASPSLFEKSTYKLGKDYNIELNLHFDGIASKDLEEGTNKLVFNETNSLDQIKPVEVEVKKITSVDNGLCYSIEIKQALKTTRNYVKIFLFANPNLSDPDNKIEFRAALSNQSAEVVVFFSQWQIFKGVTMDLNLGSETLLGLTRQSSNLLEEKGLCQSYKPEVTQSQCLKEKGFRGAITKIRETCPRPCIVPAYETGLKFANASSRWSFTAKLLLNWSALMICLTRFLKLSIVGSLVLRWSNSMAMSRVVHMVPMVQMLQF